MSKLKRPIAYVVLVLLASTCLCPGVLSDEVVWVRVADHSLWKTSIPPKGEPTLLYGHGVGDTDMVPSPDGRYVAIRPLTHGWAVDLYDTQDSGIRRVIRLPRKEPTEEFLRAWAPDGRGVLVSKSRTDESNLDGTPLGVYEARPDGNRTLLVPPRSATSPCLARYSPDRSLLAIEGDGWLQVVRADGTAKTIMYKTDLEGGRDMQWVGCDRLVLFGTERLLLVDVAKRTVNPWIKYDRIASLIYSPSRSRIYATMWPSTEGPLYSADPHSGGLRVKVASEQIRFYSIDPNTGGTQEVPLGGLEDVRSIYGVTNDGRYAVVCASDPGNSKTVRSALWVVELDTGKHWLVSDDASAEAAIITRAPSPPKTIQKSVEQQNR